MGAAAITVMSAAGTVGAAPAKVPGKVPSKLSSGVMVPITQVGAKSLQVRVAITGTGMVVDTQVNDKPKGGLSDDNRVLHLGVTLDEKGGIAIAGLNSVITQAQKASSGRCWIDQSEAAVSQSFDQLKPSQMAKF